MCLSINMWCHSIYVKLLKNVLQFLEHKFYISLVTFIPNYFMLLVNIIVTFIFIQFIGVVYFYSTILTFVYWYFTLQPSWTHLLAIIIFLADSKILCWIFCIQDHVICRSSFISSFPIWMYLTSFSCLISIARISSTCWIDWVRVGTLLLILIWGRKYSVFHH